MNSSHHPSSPHWTTHWHWVPGQFALHLWILESHLIKRGENEKKGSVNVSMQIWNTRRIELCNFCGICKTYPHHPHLATLEDWAPPAQRREPNTTVVLHVWWPLEYKSHFRCQTLPCKTIYAVAFSKQRRAHHFHKLCHTPEWAPLEQYLQPLISTNVASPVHPSANMLHIITCITR